MRILCIVKRTPDSKATVRALSDGSGIDGAGLRFVCDPFDEFGVEQAVRLKESRKDIKEVVALAVGPAETAEALRHAIAMGADKAVLASGDGLPPHDEVASAMALAGAARALAAEGGEFSLIFCGKQNIDNDAGDLGPALAEALGIDHVGACTRLEVGEDGKSARAHRRIEGAEQVLEAPLPLLVTCEKGLVEPRIPPLPKMMAAKKAPIAALAAAPAPTNARGAKFVRLGPPPSRPACRYLEGDAAEQAKELVRLLREEAKVL